MDCFGKANSAKEQHNIAQYKEELNLIIMEEVTERTTGTKTEPMIESLDKKIKEKDWVAKTSKEKQEGETVEYLIVESKEGYEFIIEVDNEKETAKIIETNKTPGQKYTITYHPNGGTGETKTVEVRSGFKKKLEKNNFTRDDYIFAGWCEDKDGNGKKYMEESIYPVNGNVTLYAIWSYNVATITFDANGGTGTMESKKVTKGDTIKLTANSFQREGYDFDKWNTEADGTGNNYADLGDITTENNVTLYAIWKEKPSVKNAIKNQTVFEEKTTIPDEYGNQITIPEGFKIASDSGTDVTKGIVIEDVNAGNITTKGSQFVWIPVGEVKNKDGTKTIELSRYSYSDEWILQKYDEEPIKTNYQELATSSYGNSTALDIQAFQKGGSVTKIGGYYIGRYEAGDAIATSDRTTASKESNPIVFKSGQYVYNYVSQTSASTLSRNMYQEKSFRSDLINSYAWDTALVFVTEFANSSYPRMEYGNPDNNVIRKTGLLGDIVCNIHDLAGNCFEWSTESSSRLSSNTRYPAVTRGGASPYNHFYSSTRRDTKVTVGSSGKYCSFRAVLYFAN